MGRDANVMLSWLRPEKREANDNFNQEKGFVEYIYILMNRQHSDR